MKYLCHASLLLGFIVYPPTNAQNFGDSPALDEEFLQWKQQYMQEFQQYKDEIDREFSEFLKKEWKPFKTEEGIIRDKTPKPVKLPVAKPEPKPVIKQPKPAPVKPPKIVIKPKPKPTPKPITVAPPSKPSAQKLIVSHLGHRLVFYSDIKPAPRIKRVTQRSIQEEFDRLAREDYESLLQQLTKIKHNLGLDDWAHIQLILKLSQEYTSDKNAATILSWFILIKNGYTSRVAFSNNEIYLLLSTEQRLYDIQFFIYDKQKFYVISDHKFVAQALFSYNGRYPKKLDAANLRLNENARFNTAINSRVLSFKYKGDKYQVSVPVEKEYVDHLSTFPQMDIDVYFGTRPSTAVSQALLQQLKPLVQDRDQQDAVNFLLRFVQTAFKYATDKQQFGKENYLYIEESISYPSSDCEDRSILFAWLVRNLLGLEVVGLDFPGHIATAVLLDKPVGQTVRHGGKTYTITDPTYINARAGMKMPQFKNAQPKVIPIS